MEHIDNEEEKAAVQEVLRCAGDYSIQRLILDFTSKYLNLSRDIRRS
jgi:hypothetical protein